MQPKKIFHPLEKFAVKKSAKNFALSANYHNFAHKSTRRVYIGASRHVSLSARGGTTIINNKQ